MQTQAFNGIRDCVLAKHKESLHPFLSPSLILSLSVCLSFSLFCLRACICLFPSLPPSHFFLFPLLLSASSQFFSILLLYVFLSFSSLHSSSSRPVLYLFSFLTSLPFVSLLFPSFPSLFTISVSFSIFLFLFPHPSPLPFPSLHPSRFAFVLLSSRPLPYFPRPPNSPSFSLDQSSFCSSLFSSTSHSSFPSSLFPSIC